MGEFKAANLWLKVALWMIDMSMFMDLFAHAVGAVGTWSSVRTCLILGFICMLVSVTLVQGLVFLNELKDNKIALICLIVFALLGGLLFGIGVALNAGYTDSRAYNRFSGNLLGWASLTGILGGIFAVLELVGVKP